MDCIELTTVERTNGGNPSSGTDERNGDQQMDRDPDTVNTEETENRENPSHSNESKSDDIQMDQESRHLSYACSQSYWGVPAACGKTAESLRWFGGFRYDIAAFYQILRGDARNVKLTMYFDETETNTYELLIDVSVLVVMKNKYFGKGLMITPLAKLDNGMFDVVLLPNVGRRHTLGLFQLVPKGAHILKTDPIKGPFYFRCRKISLEPENGCHDIIGLDGEEGPNTPLTIKVLPKAIPMIYF